jgi:predicted ChrR family anti-sigma factor
VSEIRIVLQNLFGAQQDLEKFPWQSFHPGVEIVRLYGDGQTGPSSALLRYEPGAKLPAHAHHGFEHITVLRGSQRDEQGTYVAGTCVIHGAGTSHSIASDDGCVVLAIWEHPVSFVQAER